MSTIYIHKNTGEALALVRQHGEVGTFDILDSEVERHSMRVGRSRCIAHMGNVNIVNKEE